MTTVTVPANEHGVVRLFSLSMPAEDAQFLRDDPEALQSALGTGQLDPQGVEIFQISDLADVGLIGYLRDGVDAQEADLMRDGGKIAALAGWVMVVHSTAFDGNATTMKAAPALTLIGTYRQNAVDKAPINITSDAARPYTGSAPTTPPQPAKGGAGGAMVVIGVIVLAILIIWWVLS